MDMMDVSMVREYEQDMNCMFVLSNIEFQHLIGANIVTVLYGLLDCMSYIG